MSQIEITPDLLAELKRKAEACDPKVYKLHDDNGSSYPYIVVDLDNGEVQIISSVDFLPDAEHMAAADPATVLALVEEIERLRALQCWVIMRKDNRDQVFDGPFFTAEDARLHVPDSLDYEYTVELWVNQANINESEAGQ